MTVILDDYTMHLEIKITTKKKKLPVITTSEHYLFKRILHLFLACGIASILVRMEIVSYYNK